MQLVTSITHDYQIRAKAYVDSLVRHADFPCHVLGIDFMPTCQGVNCISFPTSKNAGAAETSHSTQHGAFVQAFRTAKTDEVFLHTDSDFTMQRPIEADEMALLDLPHNAVLVGYNGGAHETLHTEYNRLGANLNWQAFMAEYGEWIEEKNIFNVGCIAMTKQTWRKVNDYYMERWSTICGQLSHPARQQWLVSYSLHALNLDIRIMPWSFHAHGHFGLKPGMEKRGDGVYHNGRLALFRHYL